MKRSIIALGTAAALVASAAAFAPQDEWEQQVRRMLNEAAGEFRSRGFEMSHRIYTGSLDDGEEASVTLTLESGRSYHIMGACDTDCSDLDMHIYNAAGTELDSDVLPDDFPVVSVAGARAGEYRVRVTMASCSAEPCRFGVAAFVN